VGAQWKTGSERGVRSWESIRQARGTHRLRFWRGQRSVAVPQVGAVRGLDRASHAAEAPVQRPVAIEVHTHAGRHHGVRLPCLAPQLLPALAVYRVSGSGRQYTGSPHPSRHFKTRSCDGLNCEPRTRLHNPAAWLTLSHTPSSDPGGPKLKMYLQKILLLGLVPDRGAGRSLAVHARCEASNLARELATHSQTLHPPPTSKTVR
jgi:hypothetical protein